MVTTKDIADAQTKAKEFLELLQIWGMERRQCKRIVERMLSMINDNTYPWKDMSAENYAETKAFLQASGSLPKETKQ